MKIFLPIYLLAFALSSAASTLWTENFEGTFPPAGWIENSVEQKDTHKFQNSTNSAKLNAAADFLITPKITTGKNLIFWTHTTSSDPDIVVDYAHNTSGPWTEFATSPFSGYTDQWNGQWVDLSALSDIYIRFRKSGSGSLYIDDVSLEAGVAVSNQPPVIEPIGNQTVFHGEHLSFNVSATDSVDNDTVTLSISNPPAGSTFNNGLFTWPNAAPIGLYTIQFYATDNDGFDQETITISVQKKPLLLITEIADPAGTGGGDYRFVELYNADSAPIILDAELWFLSKQNNGEQWTDVPLIGTIPAGAILLIAYNATDFQAAYGFAPDQDSRTISGNGDDAYFLYVGGNHSTGTLIDLYGEPNTNGKDAPWEYTDSRAVRKSTVLQPNTTWTSNEWVIVKGATTNDMQPKIRGSLPQIEAPTARAVLLEQPISFNVIASDPIDGDTVTITATNLPTGATFEGNTFTWNHAAPVGTYTVTLLATDADGTTLETIELTVLEKPQLILSEIADPSDDGGDAYRYVELYNTGTTPIDLAADRWHLSKQVNGGTWADIPLVGIVSSTWTLAFSAPDFEDAYKLTPNQESSAISGNGDDAYLLYLGGDHTTGLLVDIYGEPNINGKETDWEYTDSRAVRKNHILEPSVTWTASEWTIHAGATTQNMTPGEHGPVPEFQGLENIFIFQGDNLSMEITATNPHQTDPITITATALPNGATYQNGTLNWTRPPAGDHTATLRAEGQNGTTTKTITITVSSTSKIDTYFYGWENDTIIKLKNGQYWRNTGGVSDSIEPPLRRPEITITNQYGARRIFVEKVNGYKTVERINITESTLKSPFNGLHNGNHYTLTDGTRWKQISFENINSTAAPITTWRWNENGKTKIRFLDRKNSTIGTCEIIPTGEPENPPIISRIDGWFQGWENRRIFALENGQIWQQTVATTTTADTLRKPQAIVTNHLGTGTLRLIIEGAGPPNHVEVRQLTNITKSTIAGTFHGLGKRNIYQLANGSWWQQTSHESTVSRHWKPAVFLWNEAGSDTLQFPTLGKSVTAKQLHIQNESTITNSFTGLRYRNIYRLEQGGDWLQISFEKATASLDAPKIIQWTEANETHLMVRNESDKAIGICTVVAPEKDSDGDQISNADEALAGTDIFDAGSKFEISETTYTETGQPILHWDSVKDRQYTIERAPSLTENFQPLETLTWPQNSWTDTVHAVETKSFYRISVRHQK